LVQVRRDGHGDPIRVEAHVVAEHVGVVTGEVLFEGVEVLPRRAVVVGPLASGGAA